MSWTALEVEFDAWRAAEITLPFWWRDDDAVDDSPALRQLIALADDVESTVHLAVIPAHLQNGLVAKVAQNACLIPVTHGFAHVNNAAAGLKKCEFSAERGIADVAEELGRGQMRLREVFGSRLAPLFVPPWNRFDGQFDLVLQDLGYAGLSTFAPRKERWTAAGLERVNTHVDPIEWHGTRSLIEPEKILDHTVKSLQDRRLGRVENDEPFGFLTHHLVHDAAIWDFSERFLGAFFKGPIRPWSAFELVRKG